MLFGKAVGRCRLLLSVEPGCVPLLWLGQERRRGFWVCPEPLFFLFCKCPEIFFHT